MSIQDIPGDVLAMADMEGEAMEARQRERARKKIEADRAETLDAQARANSEGGPGRPPPVPGYDLARYRQAEALRLRMKAVLGTPDVVCLCGSTRFPDAYRVATRNETLAGRIVLSVGLFGHQEMQPAEMAQWPEKGRLDAMHLRKIEIADEVLALNCEARVCRVCRQPCDIILSAVHDPLKQSPVSKCCASNCEIAAYVGASTASEIAFAIRIGKPVRWLHEDAGADWRRVAGL